MKYPYWLNLLLGLDRLGAVLLFNTADMCISSLCWLMLVSAGRLAASDDQHALVEKSLATLKLYAWQEEVLILLGRMLERINPGHCYDSTIHEVTTAMRTVKLLQL